VITQPWPRDMGALTSWTRRSSRSIASVCTSRAWKRSQSMKMSASQCSGSSKPVAYQHRRPSLWSRVCTATSRHTPMVTCPSGIRRTSQKRFRISARWASSTRRATCCHTSRATRMSSSAVVTRLDMTVLARGSMSKIRIRVLMV